ncbi:hypothetical protein [Methylovirgula sp. 4M-Z18]|uniref:hypothetical protein n=1 Tax=Methylovirgula sp. 4M-Z18 TaxID=2293567 RepID=UPI0011C03660|nr:hypothetical protein [Methylovirgula sp. 4M-Z18]
MTVLLAATILTWGAKAPENGATSVGDMGYEAATVARDETDSALETLDPNTQSLIGADVKSCRQRLAVITVDKMPATPGGIFRIRSGAYLSPFYTVTEEPQRIAYPFPTPYETGTGDISIEGWVAGTRLYLSPTLGPTAINGKLVIHLRWHVDKSCDI